jgi:hypothetical protein
LFGIFDTSETVAMTINYLLSIVDDDMIEDEEEGGLTPIIIFVIVICSVFGFIILIAICFFAVKALRGNRKTLIRMNNEIQFKRGEVFQKHPLKADNIKSSDEEKGHEGDA